MKQIVTLTLMAALAAAPAAAQDDSGDMTDGFNLMEEGAKLLLRGLISEVEPAITDLRSTLEDMAPALGQFLSEAGPAFADLLGQVDDVRHYAAPEFLPNGDIIIRRKPDAPIWLPEPDAEGQEIDL